MSVHNEQSIEALDPAFAQLYAASEAQVWELGRLTAREKVFFSVVADICRGTLGTPLEKHVAQGLRLGVTTSDVRDLMRFIVFDTGYPATLAALERLAQIERDLGIPSPDSSALAGPIAASIADTGSELPQAVRDQVYALDERLGRYLDLQSRSRRGGVITLGVRERSLAAMAADVLYGTLGETLRIHAERALTGGADPEVLREAVGFLAFFGLPRAWDAFKALNAFLAAREAQGAKA